MGIYFPWRIKNALPQVEVVKALLSTLQVLADYDLAWQLQAEGYKRACQQAISTIPLYTGIHSD